MSKVLECLGEELVNKDSASFAVQSILGQGKVLALYFSAHWCPPCRNFTPKLANFYRNVKKSTNGDTFELVFVSSDKTKEEFSEYLSEMPWLALPFEKRSEKARLSKHFKVTGIPTLIFLDGETQKVLNMNGRSAVDSDPEGKNFPWKAKTVYDILKDGEYENNKGEKKNFEQDIKGKVLGLYFSAHWCPPCKMFTPKLCEAYKNINKGESKPFEIIFLSSDQTEEEFKEYFAEMPFLAMPFDSEVKEELSDKFEVEGIPFLIILDGDGNVITPNGRSVVSGDKEGKKFPWYPEPVEDLDTVSGPKLNEDPCLVYFPAGDEESYKKMKEILTPLGKESQELAKAEDRSPDLYFLVAPAAPTSDVNEILQSLCDFLGVNKEEKSLFIADIPAGKIFKSSLTDPSKEMVEKFVLDYRNEKLTGANIR